MLLIKIAAVLFTVWLILLLLGKGGFVHLLLPSALGLIVADLVALYRSQLTETINPSGK